MVVRVAKCVVGVDAHVVRGALGQPVDDVVADIRVAVTRDVLCLVQFFSNGLDLEWVNTHGDELRPFIESFHGMLARFLSLEIPTVAAVNGHAAAGSIPIPTDYCWS